MSGIGKIRHLEQILEEGITKVEMANEIELFTNKMRELGVLDGVTRKLLLTKEASEFPLSTKYLFAIGLYEITNNDKFNLDVFYNSLKKLDFLNRYPSNTQIPYARIFEKSKKYEDEYNKDLSDFTIEQLEYVLYDLKPLTISASNVNGRIICAYLDWCSKDKDVKGIELMSKSADWFNQFVDKGIKLFFSDKDILNLEEDCANYQDMAIIRLLFEGVEGKSLSELKNLRKDDINYDTGKTLLTDEDGSKRHVTLSDRALKIIEKSNALDVYYKKNGEVIDSKSGTTTRLVNNSYVIRTSITRTDFKDRPVDKMVIYRRIKTLSETINGFDHLTAKNIVRSGIIYQAKLVLDNKDKLDKEDYIRISTKFNITNWYPMKKWCNEETVKEVYKK